MWEIDISLQVLSFIRSVALGMIYCLLYDILRAFRKVVSYSDMVVSLQDFLYFLIITPVTFLFLLSVTNGEVRFYVFCGIALGFFGCRFTVSRIFVYLLKHIISFADKLFKAFFGALKSVFLKVYRFIELFFKKAEKTLKKGLKKQ